MTTEQPSAYRAAPVSDGEAFLGLVTEEFREIEHMYNEFGGVVKQTGVLVTPADEYYLPSPWQYQQGEGGLVVAGSGPWFVSAVENYVDSRQRYEGTATYVVVDEAGTLKVADVHWIGRPAGLE